MEISIEELEKNYARKSDEELIRIATEDAHGLRPEVFAIIEKELKHRNLSMDILKGALAQNRKYTIGELEEYAEHLRNLPCPICNRQNEKLNGTVAYNVKSFILFTSHSTQPYIACPECLDKKNTDAMVFTAILGWWGFPWGLIRTPQYIYKNIQAKKTNKVAQPNQILLSLTLSNIGLIETYKGNTQKLQEIIRLNKY